ncbi:hypothetical protein CONLIGDRAFT_706726 [Coniochaeta ligniaria NRRL 30616]|uniref:Uncharacterized protein n=1 Tax=Coniochaeta ligniaria NRRL 30616 TaxID=1408157 RepID=A0A1J7IFH0_9PEZI|nr:hypothetical protein CONLIGDRAFT_706726 [Coniochaeta ligniaria NRRL 30616]
MSVSEFVAHLDEGLDPQVFSLFSAAQCACAYAASNPRDVDRSVSGSTPWRARPSCSRTPTRKARRERAHSSAVGQLSSTHNRAQQRSSHKKHRPTNMLLHSTLYEGLDKQISVLIVDDSEDQDETGTYVCKSCTQGLRLDPNAVLKTFMAGVVVARPEDVVQLPPIVHEVLDVDLDDYPDLQERIHKSVRMALALFSESSKTKKGRGQLAKRGFQCIRSAQS